MAKILIVEDDSSLSFVVKEAMEHEHHTVEVSADGIDAQHRLKTYAYDLIILDWDIPFVPGIEVCRQFRSAGGKTPVLFVTGKSTIDDKELGLELGGDDYLTKPFEIRELKARVKAILRRATPEVQHVFAIGDVVVDVNQHKVTKSDKPVQLSPKEFALLEYMLRHPTRVHSAEELLRSVWKADEAVGPETIRAHIKNLRSKLDSEGRPSILSTVFGVGYKVNTEQDNLAGSKSES